jgi:hypothetical protein
MGNKTGNYPTERAAVAAIEADGFAPSTNQPGIWVKPSTTGGSLMEAPRPCLALVRISRAVVLPEYGADYFQLDWI